MSYRVPSIPAERDNLLPWANTLRLNKEDPIVAWTLGCTQDEKSASDAFNHYQQLCGTVFAAAMDCAKQGTLTDEVQRAVFGLNSFAHMAMARVFEKVACEQSKANHDLADARDTVRSYHDAAEARRRGGRTSGR